MESFDEDMEETETTRANTKQSGGNASGCIGRLVAEWRLGMFSLEDTQGKILDYERTFKPTPKVAVLFVKLFLLAWTIQISVISIMQTINPSFWIAYLSHWGGVFFMLYFMASFSVALLLPNISQEEERVNIWARITWVLYTVCINFSLIITILFWVLDYDGGKVIYRDYMQHGGIFLFVLIDGMLINRTPIRIKQILFVELLYVVYALWTYIHSITSIGNPNLNCGSCEGSDTDDDAIYSSVNWNKRPIPTLILFAGIFLVITPFLFTLIWLLSLLFKPQYYTSISVDKGGEVDEEEQPETNA
jgi:hypothetical protein